MIRFVWDVRWWSQMVVAGMAVGWLAMPVAYSQENTSPAPAATAQQPADTQPEDEADNEIRRLPTFYREVVAPYQKKKIYALLTSIEHKSSISPPTKFQR